MFGDANKSLTFFLFSAFFKKKKNLFEEDFFFYSQKIRKIKKMEIITQKNCKIFIFISENRGGGDS